MAKDIDEDLIEATIRRVKAQASPSGEGDDEESAEARAEHAIDDTIRRVQKQAQRIRHDAAEVANAGRDEFAVDDPIEATVRRVQEQTGSSGRDHMGGTHEADAVPDEEAIEAAILRVQKQVAAARVEGPETEAQVSPPSDEDDDPIAATIRRVRTQAAARTQDESSDFAPAPIPALDEDDDAGLMAPAATAPAPLVAEHRDIEDTQWPGRDDRLLGDPDTWEVAAQRLEQGLQDNSRQVRELAARLDALLPAIEQLLHGGTSAPALTVVRPQAPHQGAGWDDQPSPSGMQFGAPPRPPVLRDPSPQTATARELEEVAAPAARLRAVEAGSLDDRLPRQYRITVEDKRRGVDLVPLHRAIQGIQNVRDMSLLSYNAGVAIVLVETVGALEPETLREGVGRAMARETKIEVHNESTMVVKIQED